jgi:hypothetical protein
MGAGGWKALIVRHQTRVTRDRRVEPWELIPQTMGGGRVLHRSTSTTTIDRFCLGTHHLLRTLGCGDCGLPCLKSVHSNPGDAFLAETTWRVGTRLELIQLARRSF